MLKPGDPAPDVLLEDREGNSVSIASFRGRNLVLFFYPKDDTPGCTAEACAFRDAYESFTGAGAVVAGVSADDRQSHQRFADKHQLPFALFTDRGRVAQAAYGVPKTLGLLPGRVTFVIDASGTIRHVFNSQFLPQKHVNEALAALNALA
jgi:peroxiredoxin Q/BCP